MKKVTMYTGNPCSFCAAAKALLKTKNVEIEEIDGPIVKVRLQGACGSCPSSTMTLKMGIERKLREMIPEVSEVIQVL